MVTNSYPATKLPIKIITTGGLKTPPPSHLPAPGPACVKTHKRIRNMETLNRLNLTDLIMASRAHAHTATHR